MKDLILQEWEDVKRRHLDVLPHPKKRFVDGSGKSCDLRDRVRMELKI